MRRERPTLLWVAIAAVLLGGAAALWWRMQPAPLPVPEGERVAVPSGQEVVFADMISDAQGPDGLTLRFRFIAPAIARRGGTVSQEQAAADMQALCDSYALPRISQTGPQPAQIVVSLSDRPVEFGEPDPEATQYFEAYRLENGRCMWEIF